MTEAEVARVFPEWEQKYGTMAALLLAITALGKMEELEERLPRLVSKGPVTAICEDRKCES